MQGAGVFLSVCLFFLTSCRTALPLGQPGNYRVGDFLIDPCLNPSLFFLHPLLFPQRPALKHFLCSRGAYLHMYRRSCVFCARANPLRPPTTRLPVTRKCALTAACVGSPCDEAASSSATLPRGKGCRARTRREPGTVHGELWPLRWEPGQQRGE